MATGRLTIDLGALQRNFHALDRLSDCETAAVVKADGYGLGIVEVGIALARAGARRFFVATAEEGATLRGALGRGPEIFVLSGHMAGDTDLIRDHTLIPLVNSIDQMTRHVEALPSEFFGIQLDSGMNRLGLEPGEWAAIRDLALPFRPRLIMSHLACADEPGHAMNPAQLAEFLEITADLPIPRSLAATGGILMGADYHFDLTRPGIGLFGGAPFANAEPVVTLDLPVIQIREVARGETVGYGQAWVAQRPSRIATISAGYADGLMRALSPKARLWADDVPCKMAGRVSMDLICVDVTDVAGAPETLQILGPSQGVDVLAEAAGTIGYEILTALGPRYGRRYLT